MKNIALVAGTRPEVIKMLPVYLALKARADVIPTLILTGQHRELARDVLAIFNITPDADLAVMQPGQTLVSLTSRLTKAFADYLIDHAFDILLVQGDTTSAMIAGMLGFYHRIPIGHIEAGLRTGNLHAPFPEEFNRRVLTLAAQWHFSPTIAAAGNLAKEGITRDVYVVGNTVIDAALMVARHETENTRTLRSRFPFLDAEEKNTVLVTAHRRENFGDGIRNIAAAVKDLSNQHKHLHFVVPVHPNPNVLPVMTSALEGHTNIHLTDPLGYDEILLLIQKSLIILTDSGGIQEEAPAFHVPVLVLRNETERPEGIEAGCSKLVGIDTEIIQKTFAQLLSDKAVYQKMAKAKNPYGDGESAQRIVNILMAHS